MKHKQAGVLWILKMAWRDSRRNRQRLFLFISSIILGIGSLVAVYSLKDNLQDNIDSQAAKLLGADFEIDGNKPATDSLLAIMRSFDADSAEEWNFASMAIFPESGGGSRLVQVRAIKGNFPFYGELETAPQTAGRSFLNGQKALADRTLMLQFGAETGDSIQIGDLNFEIAGELRKAPGQTGIMASVAPVVYIPLEYLEATGLTQKGSRINYKYYFKFYNQVPSATETEYISNQLDKLGYDLDTVASQKRQTGRLFDDLTGFLSLVSFIALLLGCIGVAGAIHIYTKEKYQMIAILRCLGASSRQAFMIFLVQVLALGLVGAISGAFLGSILQYFLPGLLKDFIPLDIESGISWNAIYQGIAVGLIITLLFAFLPLVKIKGISPLNTLRVSFEKTRKKFSTLTLIIYLLIAAFLFAFAKMQTGSTLDAIAWVIGILIVFAILYLTAMLLILAVKYFFPYKYSFVWRQGISNLFRPNNQTSLLLISVGLGTFTIALIFILKGLIMNSINLADSENRPNLVVFDIRTEQINQIKTIAENYGLPAAQTEPIVNMRLEKLNELSYLQAAEDTGRNGWIFNREYRVTYRDSLTKSETITGGTWYGNKAENGNIYISIDEGFANRHELKLGDTMVFNLQGVLIQTIIGSFRQIEWNNISTNFLVVFPSGVLENAPQFHVFFTKVNSNEQSASFQKSLVKEFPNVSVIDIGLVISILEGLIEKVGFVISFIAAFSILTGLIVLIASVLISKFQRIKESVLLRTLGASGKQIIIITIIEYAVLGVLAASTGILLSFIAGWLLAEHSFDTKFSIPWLQIVLILFAVTLLTTLIGMFNIRQVIKTPPLEVLRTENN